MSFPPTLVGAVVLLTAAAAVTDLRTRRIPNWLTTTAAVLAVLFYTAVFQLPGLLFSLSGFGVGFGILFVLWLIGGGGGGDVKLMGAVGAMLGPKLTLIAFVLSVVLAVLGSGAYAAGAIASGGLARFRRRQGSGAARPRPARTRRLIPFALPVAIGTWLALAWQICVP